MALIATLRFVPEQEDIDGSGWEVSMGQDNEAPVSTKYLTITEAQDAIRTEFQTDPDVDGYFQQAAEAEDATVRASLAAGSEQEAEEEGRLSAQLQDLIDRQIWKKPGRR